MTDERYSDGTMTRKQLLGALRERGYPVKASALSYWEFIQHLPKGVVRHVDGAPKSLYPPEAIDNVITYMSQPDTLCPCCGNKVGRKPLAELGKP